MTWMNCRGFTNQTCVVCPMSSVGRQHTRGGPGITTNILLVRHIQPVLPPQGLASMARPLLPCSRSNDRQPRDCSVPPHVSSLRDLSTSAPAVTLPSPLAFFHPRSGAGSYRADAPETARDRRPCSPYRDEGWLFAMEQSSTYRLLSSMDSKTSNGFGFFF